MLRGIARGIGKAVVGEMLREPKKRKGRGRARTPRHEAIHVDQNSPAWCPFCKSNSAYYDGNAELKCITCNRSQHGDETRIPYQAENERPHFIFWVVSVGLVLLILLVVIGYYLVAILGLVMFFFLVFAMWNYFEKHPEPNVRSLKVRQYNQYKVSKKNVSMPKYKKCPKCGRPLYRKHDSYDCHDCKITIDSAG